MAASGQHTGHQCDFVEQVNEEFRCGQCSLVARDLTMAVCCGQHYCQECISPFQESSKPCPGCGQVWFTVVPHMRHRKSILALEVCCMMKERGCEWTGVLQDLDAHLDVDTGDCQFVDVQCPNKCSQSVPKCKVPDHLKNSCSKRHYNCRYCGFTGSYEEVCNEHYPQCDSYPIPCPNSCTVVSMERGTLEMHLKMCPYQEVECEVMGCGERFTREELDTHMERNTQKHIALMAAATQRMSREFQLKEEERKIESRRRESQIAVLERKLLQKKKQVQELEQRLKIVERHVLITPITFVLHNFAQHRAHNTSWTSPAFFTHIIGYKLCLVVWPNGLLGAHNRTVSVKVCSMKGEFDDTLQWPAEFSITVHLRNQHRDKDHYLQSRKIRWTKPEHEVTEVYWLTPHSTFISHAALEWDPEKQTQYLKNDCLLFEIAVSR